MNDNQETVAFNLAVMLYSLDIEISLDHAAILMSEGYDIDAVATAACAAMNVEVSRLKDEIEVYEDHLDANYADLAAYRTRLGELQAEDGVIYLNEGDLANTENIGEAAAMFTD